MDEEEYSRKFVNLRILKGIRDYLKSENDSPTAVYPIRVPNELLYQVLRLQGSKSSDELIHHIFKLGLTLWSENIYKNVFGSEQSLEEFIELVKKRNRERK